jgi:Carboxypeptidase regulatory-like domain
MAGSPPSTADPEPAAGRGRHAHVTRFCRSLTAIVFAVVVAACASSGSSGGPSPSPVMVTTPEAAVARVVDHEPRLAGIGPQNPDAIGQASWYEVTPASGVGAFVVQVRIGWGDCPAGCMDEHRWTYGVAPDGTVRVVAESGPPVPDDAWPGAASDGRTGIRGIALAGPVCPVERIPPDPKCGARPIAGAVVSVHDQAGTEVATTTTGADGTYFVELPVGRYVVTASSVDGLLGAPAAQEVVVDAGGMSTVDLSYDTGIRLPATAP